MIKNLITHHLETIFYQIFDKIWDSVKFFDFSNLGGRVEFVDCRAESTYHIDKFLFVYESRII